MIEPVLKYIDEPLLTFGNAQKAIDPRDGLMVLLIKRKSEGLRSLALLDPRGLGIRRLII